MLKSCTFCGSQFVATILLLCASVADGQASPIEVSLDPSRWTLSQRNFKIPEEHPPVHNAELLAFAGRQSFHLARGLAYTTQVDFENGTIDVDIAADSTSRFFGIAFHVKSDDDYEVIFFRPRSSGTDQAVQYTPGLLGANVWQLYTGPGYSAPADLSRNQWIHARIVVAGLVAKLFLNNSAEPALVVPDLKLGKAGGSVGFGGHLGGGYFSNLRIAKDPGTYDSTAATRFQLGALTNWQLSEAFDVSTRSPETYPEVAHMTWQSVRAETPGMVVINRYRRSPNVDTPEREDRIRGRMPAAEVVFAKTIIHSDREQIRKLQLGYSDDVVVYLNGTPLFVGNNELGFHQANFLGLLDTQSDAVFLPLQAGDNELLLAVTEFFGGWGFRCQLAE
jgi:hypothetical protein